MAKRPHDALCSYKEVSGYGLVSRGVADLRAGRESIPAFLVALAPGRLGELGIEVPPLWFDDAPDRLYVAVEAVVGDAAAHSHYNALRRRLVSFMHAAAVIRRSEELPIMQVM